MLNWPYFPSSYLTGSKKYRASGELGFETETLDMEGEVKKRASFDHVTSERLESIIQGNFVGSIKQIPPIYSALRVGGKRLHQLARDGSTVDDVKIDPREVRIDEIKVLKSDELPKFDIDVECGGGTYIRSLIRDIGYKLDTVATMTALERTKQGQFAVKDCLEKEMLTADSIYAAVEGVNDQKKQDSASEEQQSKAS